MLEFFLCKLDKLFEVIRVGVSLIVYVGEALRPIEQDIRVTQWVSPPTEKFDFIRMADLKRGSVSG